MALVNCPECGKSDVSSYAKACPGCGFPVVEYLSKQKNDPRSSSGNGLASGSGGMLNIRNQMQKEWEAQGRCPRCGGSVELRRETVDNEFGGRRPRDFRYCVGCHNRV